MRNEANQKVRMIILAAPSGAGKSSFVEKITKEIPRLRDTVTYTTRSMRAGESEGNPYHFVSKEKFEELKAQDFFVGPQLGQREVLGLPGPHQGLVEHVFEAGRGCAEVAFHGDMVRIQHLPACDRRRPLAGDLGENEKRARGARFLCVARSDAPRFTISSRASSDPWPSRRRVRPDA